MTIGNELDSADQANDQYLIRSATIEDVGAIAQCVEAAYQHYVDRIGKPPKPMLDDYDKVLIDHEVYVAIEYTLKQCIHGVLVLKAKMGQFLLENIAVYPNVQGKGLGKQLIALAERRATELGYNHIELYTHELMHENRKFYQKLGYSKVKEVTEQGYQRIYFEKALI